MKLKLLPKSIAMGILISIILFMVIAILSAVVRILDYYGGFIWVGGFIFLAAIILSSVCYYHAHK